MGVCFLLTSPHNTIFSFRWANVCLMQNSQTVWTADRWTEQSCYRKGPGWVLWNPLQHLQTMQHLNLPMILPLPPFAPSVQSLTAEVDLGLTLPANMSWWHQQVQSETAGGESPLHTPGGGHFCFWRLLWTQVSDLLPPQLCAGNQSMVRSANQMWY